MNRGKISFGKIGLSLGAAPPKEATPTPLPPPSDAPPTTGFGSFGKKQAEEKSEGRLVTLKLLLDTLYMYVANSKYTYV